MLMISKREIACTVDVRPIGPLDFKMVYSKDVKKSCGPYEDGTNLRPVILYMKIRMLLRRKSRPIIHSGTSITNI